GEPRHMRKDRWLRGRGTWLRGRGGSKGTKSWSSCRHSCWKPRARYRGRRRIFAYGGGGVKALPRPCPRPPAGAYIARPWAPSTGMHAPVTQLARSEARKATTSATSSGLPKRFQG